MVIATFKMNRLSFTLLVACLSLTFIQTSATVSMADEPATDVADEPTESIDTLIVNAANSSREFEFFYDDNQNQSVRLIKVEYDMVYQDDEYAEIEHLNQEARRKKRTAGIINGRGGGRRWTNNIVPYQLANVFSGRDRQQINAAISDWEKYTCLDFQQRSSGNRIYMNNGGGCYSRVGMVGGSQTLGLAPGCRVKGVVIHEIGHALGLHHEQTRPDRDNYVRIISRNIPSRVLYNFQKNSWSVIQNMNIPYDFTSIMHYGKTAFTSTGGLTIQTVDPKYQNVIGNRHGLSFRDIKSINIMYNCKRHQSGCTKTDADCPGEGFVGKDCRCWCPGGSLRNPTKSCSGGTTTGGGVTTQRPVVTARPTTRPVTQRPTGCADRNKNCGYWARRGECRNSASYMLTYCKQSCGRCGGTTGTGGTTNRNCRDYHYNCPTWRRYNYCNGRYRTFMAGNCKKSCGLCSRRSRGQRTQSCSDDNNQCAAWARIGECRRNPAYMLQSCKRSCGRCAQGDTARQPQRSGCSDRNQHCSYWAGIGECDRNTNYMNFNCKASCGIC